MSDKENIQRVGHRLVSNVIWNLVGAGAPLVVAVFAIPILINSLGIERFGVLTLAWMVVGYFSLFDFGLGRALTKLVAEKLGKGLNDEIPILIWAGMMLMLVPGVLGTIVLLIISPWLVTSVLNIPVVYQPETLKSFYWLAVSIPIVISSTGLRGVLEAHQRFGLVNVVRIPLGVLTFLGPLMVLPFSNSLVAVVAVLVISRLISLMAYMVLCLLVEPLLRHFYKTDYKMVKLLLSFGGWMTISNIVGPLMVYMDRFLIGAIVSMTAVAYYATPYEIVTKLLIIPGALMGVMFPAFATALVQETEAAVRLYRQTVNYILLFVFPPVLVIITFASEGLTLWLGSDFSTNSSLILQLLAAGVFINSLTQVPFGMVQGAGRPDITAKLHLFEFPFYLFVLWWLLDEYGVAGAAIAWVLRIVVDLVLLFVLTDRLLSVKHAFTVQLMIRLIFMLTILALAAVVPAGIIKSLFLMLALLFYAIVAWLYILCANDRIYIGNFLKKMKTTYEK